MMISTMVFTLTMNIEILTIELALGFLMPKISKRRSEFGGISTVNNNSIPINRESEFCKTMQSELFNLILLMVLGSIVVLASIR